MNSAELKQVARALHVTTERLAAELARPTDQAPDWTPFEWRIARAAASLHGVSALLASTLRWKAPPEWLAFLRDQARHTARRESRLATLRTAIDEAARRQEVPLVLLKGSALQALGLYVPGTRPMADLDVLVSPRDLARTRAAFEAMGYRERYTTPRHVVLEPCDCPPPAPFGEHEDNGITLELHTHVDEALPLRRVDLTAGLMPPAAHPGVNAYPSRAALMAHVLLHAAGVMTGRGLRLLHLQDIARLAARLEVDDWRLLRGFGDGNRGLWWAWPPLLLADRYFGGVPSPVLQDAQSQCPWWLRRRIDGARIADVSLSHPWIEAFPGIEWSGSLAEMIGFSYRRVVPPRDQLRTRRVTARTEAIYSTNSWGGLTQFQRALRWTLSRQARVATLHVVRGALTHPL